VFQGRTAIGSTEIFWASATQNNAKMHQNTSFSHTQKRTFSKEEAPFHTSHPSRALSPPLHPIPGYATGDVLIGSKPELQHLQHARVGDVQSISCHADRMHKRLVPWLGKDGYLLPMNWQFYGQCRLHGFSWVTQDKVNCTPKHHKTLN